MPKGSNLALMDLCLQVFEFFKFGKTLHLHGWERDGEAMLIYIKKNLKQRKGTFFMKKLPLKNRFL